jgi:hypothetical protein
MIAKALPEGNAIYKKTAERVGDKELLKYGEEITRMLAISRIRDVRNCRENLFHICPQIRQIWGAV